MNHIVTFRVSCDDSAQQDIASKHSRLVLKMVFIVFPEVRPLVSLVADYVAMSAKSLVYNRKLLSKVPGL